MRHLRDNLYCVLMRQLTAFHSIKGMFLFMAVLLGLSFKPAEPSYVLEPRLKDSDKLISDRFKTLVGADRLVEFRHLQTLFKVHQPGVSELSIEGDFIGAHTTTQEECVFLLGEPDQIQQDANCFYYLNASGSCKAILRFNKEGKLTFSSVSGC